MKNLFPFFSSLFSFSLPLLSRSLVLCGFAGTAQYISAKSHILKTLLFRVNLPLLYSQIFFIFVPRTLSSYYPTLNILTPSALEAVAIHARSDLHSSFLLSFICVFLIFTFFQTYGARLIYLSDFWWICFRIWSTPQFSYIYVYVFSIIIQVVIVLFHVFTHPLPAIPNSLFFSS